MNATLHSLARLGLVAAATGTVLFGTTACSLASVPADSVEQQIVSKLGAQGVSLDNGKADCATDLDATVGASQTCEFHSGGQPVGAVVTVTAVDGDTVSFDITTEPRAVPKALLQDTVASLVAQNAGVPIDTTTCDGDLAPTTGQAVGCRVTSGEDSIDVRATVTEIQGGLVNFDVEQV
ncbi:DUF4333 domain-containing protein [Pseudonocardia sp. ICBG1122]|nr:DUF4333 domain-containing protein [Pseudonocardia pini]